MSQTTRCPSCATLFKVVPDQLRISDGWVRCGHCQEVFDATLSLQEVPSPVPPPSGPDAGQRAAPPVLPSGEAAGGTEPDTQPETALPAASVTSEGAFPMAQLPMDLPASKAPSSAGQGQADAGQAADEKLLALLELPVAVLPVPQAALAQGGALFQALQPAGRELPAAVLPGADQNASAQLGVEAQVQYGLPTNPAVLEPQLPGHASAAPGDSPEVTAQVADENGNLPFSPVLTAASLAECLADQGPGTPAADPCDGEVQPFISGQETPPKPLLPDGRLAPGPVSDRAGGVVVAEAADESLGPVRPAGPEPSFVRSARRKALWHTPAVRLALGGCALLLMAALLAQVVVRQRHYLASARPQWRPALEALCVPLQCSVQPYRHIAAVAVDSASFNKLHGTTYRFALALKNQSAVEVALPAVELTLTDTSDQPVLRRVLTPAELAAPATLAPGGGWTGSLEVELQLAGNADARVAGYRVLAFYP